MRWLWLFSVWFMACPQVNSQPCTTDMECGATQRCRRGACGPICLDDAECGAAQVCANGVCAARPVCTAASDCADGFDCKDGQCACKGDDACGTNQVCTAGKCTTKPKCTTDTDCRASGGRCEVVQGVCLPSCRLAAECAPTIDPTLASTLYSCVEGACTRRCSADAQCGGAGRICVDGTCGKAQCATRSDCQPSEYCTSATTGRCLAFTPCSTTAQCMTNQTCTRLDSTKCPPGFDCSNQLCVELPRCLADADCGTVNAQTPASMPASYCSNEHCQPTITCRASAGCSAGSDCVANVCVPGGCRGDASCQANQRCVEGACQDMPMLNAVTLLRLTSPRPFVIVGESMQLSFLALTITGGSYPLTTGQFTVTPSEIGTVTSSGLFTPTLAGTATVRAALAGSSATPATLRLTVLPQANGPRVIVIDATTDEPLAGAHVQACVGSCAQPFDVIADDAGIADLSSLDGGAFTITAFSSALRSDGLPQYERASILETSVGDLLLPLRENPVKGATGFNGTVSFSEVSTSGGYWAGLVLSSARDVTAFTPQRISGDTFQLELPGVSTGIPVPASSVLYTSPGFGIPQPIKSRAYGAAEPGRRAAIAFAGRGDLTQLSGLRSVDILSYLGASDLDVSQELLVPGNKPLIPDVTDVDGDGLCSTAMRCPRGTEDVPNYAAFGPITLQPKHAQRRRTEVVFPHVPTAFTTAIASLVQLDSRLGLVPFGFASPVLGAVGNDGARTVAPFTLRSAAPFGGLEATPAGLWTLVSDAQGNAVSARIAHFTNVPLQVTVQAFLPAVGGNSLNAATRTVTFGQPGWSSAYSTGAEFARVSITGTEVRHTLYLPVTMRQLSVPAPRVVGAPGADPLVESAATVEVVAMDLRAGTTVEGLLDAAGVTLANLASAIDGYTRFER